MRVTDLRKMKEIADKHDLKIIVDNTFLSPLFQRPIELGADLVIHSGTKFLGGHNDTLAGFLCSADEETAKKIRYIYKTVGSCLAPFDSYLILQKKEEEAMICFRSGSRIWISRQHRESRKV